MAAHRTVPARLHRAATTVSVVAALLVACFTASCTGRRAAPAGLSAEFEVPGSRLRLDYAGPRDFRIGQPGASETLVADGRVYVIQHSPGRAPRVFWVDELDADAPTPRDGSATRPALVRTGATRSMPASREQHANYALPGGEHEVAITVRDAPALAAAQREVQGALDRMDMAMCSLALRYLLDWWLPQFTAEGQAVVATDAGLRLQGPVGDVDRSRLGLPPGTDVVDMRWASRGVGGPPAAARSGGAPSR